MMITIMIFVVILTDCENDDIFHKVEKWEVRDDVRMMMMVRNYYGDYDDNIGVGSNHLQGSPSPVNQLCILDMPPLFLQSLSISPYFRSFPFLVSPYFVHDTFTHHALHVLDACDLSFPLLSCASVTASFPLSPLLLL